jgi:DNA topoisomerase III
LPYYYDYYCLHQPQHNVAGNPYVKNYRFQYRFETFGPSEVTFTSVIGHIIGQDFLDTKYKRWDATNPSELFEARISSFVQDDKKPIAKNIENEARNAQTLFIWTDCDREGEHIGSEIRDIALKANPGLNVKRAHFSNVERNHVINAARRPVDLDEKQVNAVQARIELDLRIGAAFTRLQTLALKPMIQHMQDSVVSYGSCQFPTLGFVVDRYFRVKNFVPEPFWGLKVMHKKDGINVTFNWARGHLFDRMAVIVLFERCLMARTAKVVKMLKKPTSKWRPLPLTTVELQKNATKYLRMDSQTAMNAAEKLYQNGFISYPRTETDQFPKDMDLKKIVDKQQQSPAWGTYAAG